MPFSPWKAAAYAAVFAGLAAISACGEGRPAGGGGAIRIDGSSTVFPISEAAAEAFSVRTNGRVRVTVGESGTGGGFRKFCRGEIDIQDASRPILSNEMEACRAAGISYVEIPIAFDGLTVVVHPSNPLNTITMAELRTIWAPEAQGQIMNWRQVNPAWPDLQLQLFGAGTASGTFDYFTEAVVGEDGASRTDYTPSEDDNVTVQGVSSNAGAMGYFGVAYYEQNRQRLKALSIDGGEGPVAPSAEAITSGDYPLSRPMFIYVNAEALRRPEVQQFTQFFIAGAAEFATQVGYVPLPAEAYAAYAERVREIQVGTAFGGVQDVGASVAEVLARPLAEAAP